MKTPVGARRRKRRSARPYVTLTLPPFVVVAVVVIAGAFLQLLCTAVAVTDAASVSPISTTTSTTGGTAIEVMTVTLSTTTLATSVTSSSSTSSPSSSFSTSTSNSAPILLVAFLPILVFVSFFGIAGVAFYLVLRRSSSVSSRSASLPAHPPDQPLPLYVLRPSEDQQMPMSLSSVSVDVPGASTPSPGFLTVGASANRESPSEASASDDGSGVRPLLAWRSAGARPAAAAVAVDLQPPPEYAR
ncbi:hypothetical protein HK405_000241 [Cladochytrium tenue]|nr:hypothetical protein HK405_000241 [Cladochytrium tenue]